MNLRLINRHGERLDSTFHAGAPDAREIVVIGHGVTGHKDRPFLVALAEGLSRAGIPALRLSFSGNAGSEGRFTDSNITKEVGDLTTLCRPCHRLVTDHQRRLRYGRVFPKVFDVQPALEQPMPLFDPTFKEMK